MATVRTHSDHKHIKKLSTRLEPHDWRTTQRENRGSYEQRATAGKWGTLLTEIIAYQNKHNGQSPSDIELTRLTKLTLGQVRYHLRAMEELHLLRDHKGWPRHIAILDGGKVRTMTALEPQSPPPKPKKMEEAVNTTSNEVKKAMTKKPFMERAKEIAQAIVDYHDRNGHAPGIKEVSDMMGYTHAAGAGQHIRKMAALGWVHHKEKHHHDLVLTGHGRAALFGEMSDDLHTDVLVRPERQKMERIVARPGLAEQLAQVKEQMQKPTRVEHYVATERAATPPAAEEMAKALIAEMARAGAFGRPVHEPEPEANRERLLAEADLADLINELNDRGYRVSRAGRQ